MALSRLGPHHYFDFPLFWFGASWDMKARVQKLEARLSSFLARPSFDGFTKKDLFIKRLIGKPWGQDIAALSNMAEGYLNLSKDQPSSNLLTRAQQV